MTNAYLPEGRLLESEENKAHCKTIDTLIHAMEQRIVLEGRVLLCDAGRNLSIKVGQFNGIIPREEAALGIAEGTTREIAILSRVGKPVSFVITGVEVGPGRIPILTLSRRQAQALALSHLLKNIVVGDIIPITVTHLEPFGAFVDIGCGVPSMLGIENLSVSRLPHPGQRFTVGQQGFAVVTGVEKERGRIQLSHKELLGTWWENASRFSPGMAVPGYIRSIKEYGIFIELAPNLSGLAEMRPGLREGDRVSVYIKSILPAQMKLKLLVIDKLEPLPDPPPFEYFIRSGHLSHWRYAPPDCLKVGAETIFAP